MASPWERASGFRVGGAPVVRMALAEGEERAWLAIQRGEGRIDLDVDGRHRTFTLDSAAPGRLEGRLDGRPVAASCEQRPGVTVIRRHCLRQEIRDDTGQRHHASAEHEGHLRAPMPGHVLDVRVAPGQRVTAGTVLVVLEAMKMEHSMPAPWDGTVVGVPVKAGDRVEEGVELVTLAPLEP